MWDNAIELVAKNNVTLSDWFGASVAGHLQVFTAAHGKEESHVRQLLKSTSQWVFCW
jgi:hypothetical protein